MLPAGRELADLLLPLPASASSKCYVAQGVRWLGARGTILYRLVEVAHEPRRGVCVRCRLELV